MKLLTHKLIEALKAVLPIVFLVLIINYTLLNLEFYIILTFLLGSLLLIFGITLFTLGVESSLMSIGNEVGGNLTKRQNLVIIIVFVAIIGIIVTIAEPDLIVLANQINAVPNLVIMLSVGLGVGIFLVIGFLRIIFQWPLSPILMMSYALTFILALFVPNDFLAVAFDSGGVTTGPITVPFILALGSGVAYVRGGGKKARNDTFGLVALASIGPIIAVMILGIFYKSGGNYVLKESPNYQNIGDILFDFIKNIPYYLLEVGLALSPIIILFILFQIFSLKLNKRYVLKITIGLLYTLIGLSLFLTGANIGFMHMGYLIGFNLSQTNNYILIPFGMVLGLLIVMAEPAIHVLNKQVEDATAGSISTTMMLVGLSLGVAISVGLALFRSLIGISIWWFIVPGYLIALILTFFSPKLFTSIAFDSGGVASGPLTATFLLPLAIGTTLGSNNNIMMDAFGLIAFVAMTPLITIQIIGLIYKYKTKKKVVKNENAN